jgi:hypothetical protein
LEILRTNTRADRVEKSREQVTPLISHFNDNKGDQAEKNEETDRDK